MRPTACSVRLWQRDQDIIREAARSPMLTSQVARLHGFRSRKKATERLNLLYKAGWLKRTPYWHPSAHGKSEFVYFAGARMPHPSTHTHTLAIAELQVQLTEWTRTTTYSAEFFYGGEAATSGGIIPDATVLLHKADKTGLFYFEIDNGTVPVTSALGYALEKKLSLYAAHFDSEGFTRDFAWVPGLRSFRVCLVVPSGRIRYVQHLVGQEQHDFVLLTTFEQLKGGLSAPVWLTHDNRNVDLLGRQGNMHGEVTGETVEAPRPTKPTENSCRRNDFGSVPNPENPTVTNRRKNEGDGDAGQS